MTPHGLRHFVCLCASAALFAVAAAPANAQDGPLPIGIDPFSNVEPLTEEQRAQLPAARRVAAFIVPEGEVPSIGSMTSTIFRQAEQELERSALEILQRELRMQAPLQITEADARNALTIIQPAWEERQELEGEQFDLLRRYFADVIAPLVRDAVAETLAIQFDQQTLSDLEAFFATDSGATYARMSIGLGSEPRVLAAMSTAAQSLASNAAFRERGDAINAQLVALPRGVSFFDLTEEERAQLSGLTGLSVDELRQAMVPRQISDASVEVSLPDVAEAVEEPSEPNAAND